MPLFAHICTDRPGHEGLRRATRAAHLAHIEKTRVAVHAGPFLNPAGGMTGSLVVLDLPDRAAAHAVAAAEPYAQGGLLAEVRIEESKKVIG